MEEILRLRYYLPCEPFEYTKFHRPSPLHLNICIQSRKARKNYESSSRWHFAIFQRKILKQQNEAGTGELFFKQKRITKHYFGLFLRCLWTKMYMSWIKHSQTKDFLIFRSFYSCRLFLSKALQLVWEKLIVGIHVWVNLHQTFLFFWFFCQKSDNRNGFKLPLRHIQVPIMWVRSQILIILHFFGIICFQKYF